MPRNRLADDDAKLLMNVAIHLVDKKQHGDVHLQPQALLPTGDTIETIGVATAEVDGNYITMILYTLGDESLLPRQVMDYGS